MSSMKLYAQHAIAGVVAAFYALNVVVIPDIPGLQHIQQALVSQVVHYSVFKTACMSTASSVQRNSSSPIVPLPRCETWR
jgi:hypothetical protein